MQSRQAQAQNGYRYPQFCAGQAADAQLNAQRTQPAATASTARSSRKRRQFLRSDSLGESDFVVAAFRRGLGQSGHVEGQNVAIEYHFAEDHRQSTVNQMTGKTRAE